MRFDPFEGFWGKVRLESVTYKDDHGTTKSIGSNAISSNGIEDKDNYFIFKTSDPMVFIQADAGFKYLTIKGDWELLSINDIDNEFHAVNHENNLVKHEYELIKNEYTRIINSRTWCWANNLADVLRFFRFNRILK